MDQNNIPLLYFTLLADNNLTSLPLSLASLCFGFITTTTTDGCWTDRGFYQRLAQLSSSRGMEPRPPLHLACPKLPLQHWNQRLGLWGTNHRVLWLCAAQHVNNKSQIWTIGQQQPPDQKQLPINDQQQYLTQQCNNSSARLLFSVRARRQQPRYYGVYSVFYSRWPRLHFCATRSTTLATFYSLVEDSSLNLFPLTLWSP